ncbi:ADP-ribosylation factor-like protein 6-interacting protein 4 [Clytia hemisphaerica]|uniref:ADP-ribosylation factor-like protein 6-interacting protein 4 n=1 Tax=Clytia hemisphaerica TaxID=252671 RepID=UPI0034D75EE9
MTAPLIAIYIKTADKKEKKAKSKVKVKVKNDRQTTKSHPSKPPKGNDETANNVVSNVVSSSAAPKKRTMVPMTKEEYEKQQSVVRRVYDPETGRNRLIKGDGEVLEEIVSKARHKEINKVPAIMLLNYNTGQK